MRLLIASIVVFVIAGNIATLSCHPKVETRVVVKDSIVYKLAPVSDSLLRECIALNKKVDSLKTELFLSEFKAERMQYYIGIVEHDPSQLKFLKGWINRAIQ